MDARRLAPDTSTTIAEGMARYEALGHTAQARVADAGAVQCLACRATAPAEEFDLVGACRVEGTSDPEDEAIVLALVCPRCGAKSTCALPYGPAASAEEAEALRRLHDARVDRGRPLL